MVEVGVLGEVLETRQVLSPQRRKALDQLVEARPNVAPFVGEALEPVERDARAVLENALSPGQPVVCSPVIR